jgi:hypothetical protein
MVGFMSATQVLMPDAVLLARGILVADEAVNDAVGTRISTVSPGDTTSAWIRLHQIGGPLSESVPQRLATRNIQVDCFAPATDPSNANLISGDAGAMALALMAESALCDISARGFASNVGVVVRIVEMQGPQSLPDTSRTPPTPRVLFTIAITVHPIP